MGNKKEIKTEAEKSKRYIIYWHKMANSGIWGYNDLTLANRMAEDFTKQESMYEVHLLDTLKQTITTYKGKANSAKED